jgi:DNA-binding NarL/FixJ family response regulator
MINIAIADDHFVFRFGVINFIEKMFSAKAKIVLEAVNGSDLLIQLAICETLPDIILLDLSMPVMDGKKAAEIIKIKYPSIKIIFLTVFIDESFIIHFIERGFKGFLSKNIDFNILEDAILNVNKNKLYIDSQYQYIAKSFPELA